MPNPGGLWMSQSIKLLKYWLMAWDKFWVGWHAFCLWQGRLYLITGLSNGKWHKLWLVQAMVCFKCSHCIHETELSCSRVNDKLNKSHQYGLEPKRHLWDHIWSPGQVLGYLVQERHWGTEVNQRDGHQDGQMVEEHGIWGDGERTGLIQSYKEEANFFIVDFNCLVEGSKEGRARILLEVRRERTRSFWMHTTCNLEKKIMTGETAFRYSGNNCYHEGDQTLEWSPVCIHWHMSNNWQDWAACSDWIYSEQGFTPDVQVLFNLSCSVTLTAFVIPRKALVMQTCTLNMQSPN